MQIKNIIYVCPLGFDNGWKYTMVEITQIIIVENCECLDLTVYNQTFLKGVTTQIYQKIFSNMN